MRVGDAVSDDRGAACVMHTWHLEGVLPLIPDRPSSGPCTSLVLGREGRSSQDPGGGGVFARRGPLFPPQDPSLTIPVTPLSLFSSFLSFMWAWAEGSAWQPREGVPLPPALAQATGPYSSLQKGQSLFYAALRPWQQLWGPGNCPALQVPATFPEQQENAFGQLK